MIDQGRQPIAAIITSADAGSRWLTRDQPDLQRACEAITRIQEDGGRAAQIISHLKAFYRKDVSPERAPVSANDVVREMLVLLRYEADRHSVVMRTQLPADLPLVPADRVQLQQVLMNLMLNGMEAMGERGGELTSRTRGEPGAGAGISQRYRAGDRPRGAGTNLRSLLHHQGRGDRDGSGDQPRDHRVARRPVVGDGEPESGGTFHFTLPTDPEA